jgi:esterase
MAVEPLYQERARDVEITANDLRFHGRVWGNAGAPGVLILHSLTGHAWEWDPLACALADQRYVIALDQRGHGASDRAADYAPQLMAADIMAILDSLHLGRVSIVGHSMGAVNGYLAAAERPASVERLVIIDVGPTSRQMVQQVLPSALQSWEQASFGAPDEALAEWLAINPRAREPAMRRYVMPNLVRGHDGRWRWRFHAAGLQSWVEQLHDESAQWEALRRITCQTLVIRAAESEALLAPDASRMIQQLRHGHLLEIPDAGHDVHIDQPEALVAAVRSFLTAPTH